MNNFARRVESFVTTYHRCYHEWLVSGLVYIYPPINRDAIVENGRKGNRGDEVWTEPEARSMRNGRGAIFETSE